MKQQRNKWISRSLAVLVVGTLLLLLHYISETTWLWLAGAYLGYNFGLSLPSRMSEMKLQKDSERPSP